MLPAISIEDVPKEAAVEIGRSVEPIENRRSDTHVNFHHDGVSMVGSVMPARGIDDRAVHQEPVVFDVAAEVDKFVPHIAADHARHDKPANIRRNQQTADYGTRQSDKKHRRHRKRREESNTPVHMIGEAHLLVRKELMMLQRVAIIELAERAIPRRPMKPHAMSPVFSKLVCQEDSRNGAPHPPCDVPKIGRAHVNDGETGDEDHRDVQPTVVPGCDLLTIGGAKRALPIRHDRCLQFHDVSTFSVEPRRVASCRRLLRFPLSTIIGRT